MSAPIPERLVLDEPDMISKLVIVAGPDKGRTIQLTPSESLLLGRSKESIFRLNDFHVSRVHCEFRVTVDEAFITDLDSAGGTFVNGQRVSEQQLFPGCIIQIGETVLRYETVDSADINTLPPLAPQVMKLPYLSGDRLRDLVGQTLSHFQVGEVVAKARSGIVFAARDFKDGRIVALKVLWPEFSKNEEEIRRFIRSMKTMLPLSHPNLVKLYGAGKTGPYCWVAMEFVKGESLTQVIERIGTAGMLDWRWAFRVGFHIGRALEFAHKHQIIHRNITPQNIMIQRGDKGVAKLGDLMLAKALEGRLAEQITRPGEVLGDIHYMSPERARSSANVDARSDIYSLGAVLYALLTGRPPLEGGSVIDTIMKICQSEPVRPKKYQLSIPDTFEGIILRMLAKRPDDRFQSISRLMKDLTGVAKYQGLRV